LNEIRQWLQDLGLGQYADAFDENAIDLDLLPDLEDGDLEKMGIAALGHRKKILRAIKQPAEPAAAPARQAERRQLTVMFCDLVGSTALSRELDPEDLREIMRRYQDAVAGAITRYGGHVAKYLGDGVLAYFGWPQAYEDQTSRAVYASRDAITAVGDVYISNDRPLEARVGIATGQVVVGDLIGKSGSDFEAVTGETPNLAARLQSVAAPGQIVVSSDTHHLVQQNFSFEELGGHDLKGFESPIQAWGIIGEVSAESRFEASHETSLTRLVGRDEEIRLIAARWQCAVRGESQTVIISGEAGIGKSRLMQAISDQIATDDSVRIQYQCSAYHANSALYPVIQQLQREAGFETNDSAVSKLDKVEELLRQAGCNAAADAPYLAHLLSLPYEERYGAIKQSPQQIKRRQFSVLLRFLSALASSCSLLLFFEDCHWIDPTSQELLEFCVAELRDLPVLMIVTHRPEWLPPFTDEPRIAFIHLKRLDKAHGGDIVRDIAGEFISDEAVARIVARTDGIPLFIEELTKSLVEDGFDIENADIPQTLQASLLARLDRLGPEAKEICQISAVIGREFSHSLLAQVAAKSNQALEIATSRLIQSELVTRRGELPNCTYAFKHVLIQDAAYDSLLRTRRQDLHRTIAEKLVATEFDFEVEPEVIARHFSLGEVPDQAALYWSRAGAKAGERSADSEAVAHVEKGLEQVVKMTARPATERLELELNLILGPAFMNLTSFSAPEVKQAYVRARELGSRVGTPDQLFAMQFGWWVVNQMPGQYVEAKEIAAELLQLAETQSDREASGFMTLIPTACMRSNMPATIRVFARGIIKP
jgi:class 3 adenylate cyclase